MIKPGIYVTYENVPFSCNFCRNYRKVSFSLRLGYERMLRCEDCDANHALVIPQIGGQSYFLFKSIKTGIVRDLDSFLLV